MQIIYSWWWRFLLWTQMVNLATQSVLWSRRKTHRVFSLNTHLKKLLSCAVQTVIQRRLTVLVPHLRSSSYQPSWSVVTTQMSRTLQLDPAPHLLTLYEVSTSFCERKSCILHYFSIRSCRIAYRDVRMRNVLLINCHPERLCCRKTVRYSLSHL